jgi:hypothetical protein
MTIIQSKAIHFPANPTVGQEYLADNSVSYVWTGDRWSAKQAIETRQAQYAIDGLYAGSAYNPITDITLDGGAAN